MSELTPPPAGGGRGAGAAGGLGALKDSADVLRDPDLSAGEKASSVAGKAAESAAGAAATAATGNAALGKVAGKAAGRVAGSKGFRYLVIGIVCVVAFGFLTNMLVLASTIQSIQQTTVRNPNADENRLVDVSSELVNVPPEYVEIVTRAGSICPEVPPQIIAAQIQAESNWRPKAGSSAGAQGIAQFMPGTWAAVGKDGNGDGVADVWNPIDAIWTQGNYMCGQVSAIRALQEGGVRIDGDILELALAAYNAGLGNVQRAHGIPPFAETQSYVSTIIANASTYGGTLAPDEVVQKAINAAKAEIGKPYVWAAQGPNAFDCSGLMTWAYAKAGVTLTHQSVVQSQQTKHYPRDQAVPGDLLFWSENHSESGIYHVAMYLGDGKMIESPQPGSNVRITTVYDLGGQLLNYVGRVRS